jgi:hypothetical protein
MANQLHPSVTIPLSPNTGSLLGISRQAKSNNLSSKDICSASSKAKGYGKNYCKSLWTQNTEQLLPTWLDMYLSIVCPFKCLFSHNWGWYAAVGLLTKEGITLAPPWRFSGTGVWVQSSPRWPIGSVVNDHAMNFIRVGTMGWHVS